MDNPAEVLCFLFLSLFIGKNLGTDIVFYPFNILFLFRYCNYVSHLEIFSNNTVYCGYFLDWYAVFITIRWWRPDNIWFINYVVRNRPSVDSIRVFAGLAIRWVYEFKNAWRSQYNWGLLHFGRYLLALLLLLFNT